MLNIKKISTTEDGFQNQLEQLLAWESVSDESVNAFVKEVIKNVRQNGDQALLDYTAKFDRLQLQSGADLEIASTELEAALHRIPAEQKAGLELAAERVRSYHENQLMKSWNYTEADGTMLGQQVTATG